MSDEGILGRWSRRKAQARAAPEPLAPLEAPAQGLAEEPVEAVDPELMEQTSEAAIAALTGESDITVFLKKGVAGWAKNAALRRAWAMDPAICDFVGEARDYGYDWNSGEGVPGFGPILAGDNATSILDTMFSDVSLMNDPVLDAESADALVSPAERPVPTSAADELAARRARDAAPEPPPEIAAPEPSAALPLSDAAPGEPEPQLQSEVVDAPKPRRHGSATPV
ncbi:DUF3306 domain-containing protein [Beijerinckia sp. L45]|uniref:DUF3306 domain-containing protein n=1 Tax=Beijerinckia sp. L45 TaxID=1641855 RepID=UPI00131B5242|nr:DUF3306 domain-containing protein [Beijerinckia sp. L45]